MYIRSTQVQCPCDVVQLCHQHTVSMLFTQSLTNALQFTLHILSSHFYGLQHHLVGGYGRSILPDAPQYVEVRLQRQPTLLTQFANQFLNNSCRGRHTIYANRLICHISQFFAQPFSYGRRPLYLQFHQLEFSTFQLSCSSDKVARVRP